MESSEDYKETISSLPTHKHWNNIYNRYQYQGFWLPQRVLPGIISVQRNFIPKSKDTIILTRFPKSGTTWLKALAFLLTTRHRLDESTSMLSSKLPHDCVPFLEFDLNDNPNNDVPLVSTHIPYTSLPKCIVSCGCRIVYICRDPKDVFVSTWYFQRKLFPQGVEGIPLEESFHMFCGGVVDYGPYWDHVLGYWNASLEFPDKVLFLRYEEMVKDMHIHVKRLADFMGYPFSLEEEQNRVMEKIIDLCSFDNLSNLEVNKIGKHRVDTPLEVKNNVFFRKGSAGDWKNHLTSKMAKRLDSITEQKFWGFDLQFPLFSSS